MKKGQIHLGIVGTGAAARAHIKAFQNIHSVHIAGIAGRDTKKAAQLAKEYKIPTVYASGGELVREPRIQAVVFALPPFLEPPLAVLAFQHRKHVLCEKPLGVRLHDVKKIHAAWRKSGKIGMVNFCYRLIPQFQELKSEMAAGRCGSVHFIHAEWISSNRLLPHLTYHWKGQKELGGGALQNFGIHLLDYLFYDVPHVKLLGSKQSTFIKMRLDEKGRKHKSTGDELTTALLALDNGTVISIHISFVTRPQRGCHVVVQGSEGTMELRNMFPENPAGPFSLSFYNDTFREGKRISIGKKNSEPALVQLFSRSAQLFIKAIHEKRCIYPSIEDGLKAQKILFQIQQKAL